MHILYSGKKINVPESIEDLTAEQYYRYLEIALFADRGALLELQARLKLLSLFLSLPVDVTLLPKDEIQEALELIGITDPFIIASANGYKLDLKTGCNLLPVWKKWRGPDDMLNGVSFDTFCKCMALVKRIGHDQDDDILQQFGALLYSDGKGNNPPALLCLHAYIFFLNVFNIIQKEPLEIDGDSVDLRILFKKDGKAKPDDHTGWTGVGMDIAENGVFGNYSQVKETPFWDILLFLYKNKFERLHSKK